MYKNKNCILKIYSYCRTSWALSSSEPIVKQSQLSKLIKKQRNSSKTHKKTVDTLRKHLYEDQGSTGFEEASKKVAAMSQEEIKKVINDGYKRVSFSEVKAEAALDEAASRLQLSEADRLKYLSACTTTNLKRQEKLVDSGLSKRIAKDEKVTKR